MGTTEFITTTTLLDALADPGNDAVYREFDTRFRPVVFHFARSHDLPEAEAEEVAQVTMSRFALAYRAGRYDRIRGRLSSWLLGIAKNCVHEAHRQRQRQQGWRGDSKLIDLENAAALTRSWDRSMMRTVLARAAALLREETKADRRTIHIFELVYMTDTPFEAIADQYGLDVAEVYRIKHRMTRRLRKIVNAITSATES